LKRTSRMCLYATLFIAFCFLVQSACAFDVTVNPSSIPISGQKGKLVMDSVQLTNHENTSVTVNVLTNAPGLSAIPQSVFIGPNSSSNLGIVYTLQSAVSSGNITFSWQGTSLNVSVVINDTTPPPSSAPVEIFPSAPQSGSSIAVYFTGTKEGLSASGFLYCNGYLYRVDMINGFGIVDLDRGAYGEAQLYLFGNAIEEDDTIKTFTIARGTGKSLSIDVQDTATVSGSVKAKVMMGTEPLEAQQIMITAPSENTETLTTNANGEVNILVDEVGKWKVATSTDSQTAIDYIDVQYGKLDIAFSEGDIPEIGRSITIKTRPDAKVSLFINGEFIEEYIASSEGFLTVQITNGGRYTLEGKSNNLRGSYSFNVPGQAVIEIIDQTTGMPVQAIEKEKSYLVRINDYSGNYVTEVDSVWIASPLGTKELLPLSGGSGTWTPITTGSYLLSVDGTESIAGATKYIAVTPSTGIDIAMLSAITLISILAIFVVTYIYSKKRGITLKQLFSFSILKRKGKVEIPIG